MILSPGWTFDHVYLVGDGGASDEHWITRFAMGGGDAIITADSDFSTRPPQIVAVAKTGVKVIHLPKKWASAPAHLQAAHIMIWWPRIEAKIMGMERRECYQPEWNVSGETGVFKKIDINFGKAQKKMRRARLKER